MKVHHLEAAVRSGIITQQQLDALLALEAGEQPPRGEPRRGLNVVTIAYWAGAIAVLFALAWFLAARWRQLGAGGVFVVSAVYAASFAAAAWWLIQQRYRTAASFATFLVVATVPALAWSVLSLFGWWYEPPNAYLNLTSDTRLMTRWIPIDVATLVAALAALRLVRFSLLTAAAAISFWYLVLHIAPAVIGARLVTSTEGWTVLLIGACLLACGAVALIIQGRKVSDDAEDYAFWPFVIGLCATALATGEIWANHRSIVPHVMLAAALGSVALSIRIRRREFLVAGAVGFVCYLAWLAFDVFRKTLGFPIVLAGFGLAVILSAVWVQRRYPGLLRGTPSTESRPG